MLWMVLHVRTQLKGYKSHNTMQINENQKLKNGHINGIEQVSDRRWIIWENVWFDTGKIDLAYCGFCM